MPRASERYSQLSSGRSQFLDMAVECSELTLPYLVQHDNNVRVVRNILVSRGRV